MATQGLWNIGGVNLPDFGISEALGVGPRNSAITAPEFTKNTIPQTGEQYIRNQAINTGATVNYTKGPYGGVSNVTYRNPAPQSTTNNTSGSPAPSGGSGPTDAQYDALGIARGDIGGYERVMREQQGQIQAQEDRVRNEINSGFDAYISGLDQMLGNIPGQRQGQEQIVQNSFNQGVSDLTAQKTSSQQDLDTQRRKTQEGQVKTLNDIADNIRNLFQTGNVMLGSRGAGDSSAANQYSYAVTKLGSKQRGDVLAQTRSIEADIQDREAKLNNIFTQETAKLRTERDNNILQIAQYFQDKQNELIQAKAQGQLQRGQSLAQLSTQLLNQAQQYLMQADADFKNKQNALMTWATNNATTIGQLKSNLAAVGQYNAPGIQAQSINGSPTFDAQGNMTAMWSTGNRDEKLRNPFLG